MMGIQKTPHAMRQHRRDLTTVVFTLLHAATQQRIGQIEHRFCQTAAYRTQIVRIRTEQIQQPHGFSHLRSKLSAGHHRILPRSDQTIGRQPLDLHAGQRHAVRPDLPHLIGLLAVQHTLIADNNVALSNRVIPVIHHVLSVSAAHIKQLQTVFVYVGQDGLSVVVIAVDRNTVDKAPASLF